MSNFLDMVAPYLTPKGVSKKLDRGTWSLSKNEI